ncbi:MAG TPA: hypothetical protein VJ208_02170 [Candidatus Nanoarchaeia archaeon]|nr:hypothetical protein [Candidatus Nanoarchaeia archaeon]
MLNKKELSSIVATTIILSLAVSIRNFNFILYGLASIFFIILINVFAKKISAYYLESEIEIKIWEVQRYGFKPGKYFKKPVLMGAYLPVLTSVMSLGYFPWLASLVFDVKPKVYRAAKRHGLYSFSEMTEEHLGYIAASGILANLIFSVIGYFIGFSEFASLNVYYAFFNILPLSDLDGNKIFFGNLVLWSFIAALVLIGMGYVLFAI